MAKGKITKSINSPNTNLDTPSIKCLEKLLTFGTGPEVSMGMEEGFTSFLQLLPRGSSTFYTQPYSARAGLAAVCFSNMAICNSKGITH